MNKKFPLSLIAHSKTMSKMGSKLGGKEDLLVNTCSNRNAKISRSTQTDLTIEIIRYPILKFELFSLVPESAPPLVTPKKQSSTVIRVLWNTLSDFSHWNGIGTGYELQYRLNSSPASNWTSYLINGISNRQCYVNNLLKYRVYEFRVAARTIKGSGPFSSVVDERTKEDSKC